MTKQNRILKVKGLIMAWTVLMSVLAGCSGSPIAPFVRLRLMGLPAGVDRVTLTASADGQSRTVEFTAGADPFDLITVSFPSGQRGDVTFSLLAYQGMCLVGSGSGSLNLSGDEVREVPIPIKIPSLPCGTPAAQLTVHIKSIMGASGSVKSVDPGISCEPDCEEVYAVGTPITLQARPQMSTFSGWLGACSGTADCTIRLDQEGTVLVDALFGPCQGWCEEPSGTTENLYGIWGTGSTNVIAVGDRGTILKGGTGQPWSPQSCPIAAANLRAIGAPRDGGNLIAVGLSGAMIFQDAATSDWRPLNDPSGGKDLLGVAGTSANEMFIVGAPSVVLKGSTASNNFAVKLPNGAMGNPPSTIDGKRLNAISAAPSGNNNSFVGQAGINLRRHTNLANMDIFDNGAGGSSQDLLGVYYGDKLIVAVGQGGTILHRGPPDLVKWPDWSVHSVPNVTATLNGIWGPISNPPDSLLFAVGDQMTILSWDGMAWTVVPLPNIATDLKVRNLHAVWGTDPNNLYAVGDGGTILHFVR